MTQAQHDTRVGMIALAAIAAIIWTVIIFISGNSSKQQVVERQKAVAAPENDKPVDLKEQILKEARKTARKNYIDGLQEDFRNTGVDASASDIDGELIIVSDALKLKPDRDKILRQQFGPAARRNLCTMGFKTLALKSGVLFGDGDEYSLGCPETKEEKETRQKEQRARRQEFVDDLQRAFGSDPQQDFQVTQQNNEIVLTGSSAKGLTPQLIQELWGSKFSDEAKKNFCRVGFRGLRVRGDANSGGTFISFGCGG